MAASPTPAHHASRRVRWRPSSGANHCSELDRHDPAAVGVSATGVHLTHALEAIAIRKKENCVRVIVRLVGLIIPLIYRRTAGAGARGRTEMTLRSGDFESPASANSATPARVEVSREVYSDPINQLSERYSGFLFDPRV